MYQFQPANQKWWNKPLVLVGGRRLPAELVILDLELKDSEEGVWMNSRKPESGVIDLLQLGEADFKTARVSVPGLVTDYLCQVYMAAKLKKGCPDLVIWNRTEELLRLVEVKCPHWDRPTPEQEVFMDSAESIGIPTSIVEWEFEDE